jgi:hypothetical protein
MRARTPRSAVGNVVLPHERGARGRFGLESLSPRRSLSCRGSHPELAKDLARSRLAQMPLRDLSEPDSLANRPPRLIA